MFIAKYSKTMAGAARRAAQQRGQVAPTVEARKPETPPAQSPVAGKVVRLVIPKTEIQIIIEDIARQHGITVADIMGRSLSDPIVAARFDAIAAVKQARPMISFPRLGRIFNRDSATIRNALKKRGLA